MTSYQLISRVVLSFAAAFILTVLPLPAWLWWWRPVWVALVLMFWVVEFPAYISFGTAFCVGILYDVLSDMVLGEHAVAFLMIVAISRSMIHVIRTLSVIQQSLFVFFVLLLYEILIIVLQGMFGQLNHVGWFWLPAFMSMLVWPWIYGLLNDFSGCLRSRR